MTDVITKLPTTHADLVVADNFAMRTKICIKKLDGLILAPTVSQLMLSTSNANRISATIMAEMMKLGYCPSHTLFDALQATPVNRLVDLRAEILCVLKHMKGADVNYTPMYPNFPQQVMDASDVELFFNAVCHYWSAGEWKPTYETLPRELAFEATKFKEIGLTTEEQFEGVFTSLLSSNDSLSDEDKGIVEWFIKNRSDLTPPKVIPFKETMCIVAGLYLEKGLDITPLVKTATDVLRIVTYVNGGDVSLAANTKFKSMPRSKRRIYAKLLDAVASEEDINRHRSKWTKLFHSLHIGDYSKRLYEVAKKIRNNKRILTYNGRIYDAINDKNLDVCIDLLLQRPGEFARRLDHILRVFENDQMSIIDAFGTACGKIPTKVLLQILGHLQTRGEVGERVVFPKGVVQHAKIIPGNKPLPLCIVAGLTREIESSLCFRFNLLEPLGKVYLDPALKLCPIPSQQRSASEGAFNVARGTRLDIGKKNTLRFFIYWVGQDIDLSATLHDENFKMIEQISYTHLRSAKFESCHSGDIVTAPNGDSEFIDITIDKAAEHGIRYVVMNVLVYAGPTFKEHAACYAGWMTRSKPKSNEIYDPKTVSQKVDLKSNCKNSIPVVFDLVERKAIWCDLSTRSRVHWGKHLVGNNIHANAATIEQTMRAIVESNNKLSLYQLFELHAQARGEIVDTKEEADAIFSLDEGITPYNINTISSEFIV